MFAFGRVRIDPPGAGARWIDDGRADIVRSKGAWNLIDQWAGLDRHAWQGRTVPELSLARASGPAVAVPDSRGPMLLWPWRSY